MKNLLKRKADKPIIHTAAEKRIKRTYITAALMIAAVFCFSLPVYAATPLDSINSLSDFIFAAIKAIGLILLGFGIVQIGLSLKSHDPGQRANGFMTFFGGVVIAFAKDILDMII